MANDDKGDILDDLDPTGPEETETTEPPAPEPQATGDEKTGPPPVEDAPTSQPPQEGEWVPRSALEDERRKRQEMEARIEAAKPQELTVPEWAVPAQRQQSVTPEAPPSLPPSPKVYDSEGQEVDLNGLIQNAIKPFQERLDVMADNSRLEASEMAARGRHEDFDQVLRGFAYEAALNPSIKEQARRASDPAEFCYQVGMRRIAFERSMSSMSPATSNGQPAAPQAEPEQQQPKVPQSLSDKAAPGGASNAVQVPDDPLDDINKHFM